MLIFQFNQEKLDEQEIPLTVANLAFWNGYIEQSNKGFVLLPPYIDYICNRRKYKLYSFPIDEFDGWELDILI